MGYHPHHRTYFHPWPLSPLLLRYYPLLSAPLLFSRFLLDPPEFYWIISSSLRSTLLHSFPLGSSHLFSAQIGSSLILSSLSSPLRPSPLRTSWILLSPLGSSPLNSTPLRSSMFLYAFSSPLRSSPFLLDPLRFAFSLLLFDPIHSASLISSPLLYALLRPTPLWEEENISFVGFSSLCAYTKKLTTRDTSLLLLRQMELVNSTSVESFIITSINTLIQMLPAPVPPPYPLH